MICRLEKMATYRFSAAAYANPKVAIFPAATVTAANELTLTVSFDGAVNWAPYALHCFTYAHIVFSLL